METAARQQQLMDQSYILPTDKLSGSFQIRADFLPKYVSVLNSSKANISIKDGEFLTKPSGTLPINDGVYLSFSIRESTVYTVFWETDAFLSHADAQFTVRFSDQPIFLQGGNMTGGSILGTVEIGNIPTVNVGGTVATSLTNPLPVGGNKIGNVGVTGALPAGTNALGTMEITKMPAIEVAAAPPKTYAATVVKQSVVGNSVSTLFPTSLPCYEIFLQAASSNTGIVRYGLTAAACFIELSAGAGVVLPIDNLNKLFFIADNTTDKINVQVGS